MISTGIFAYGNTFQRTFALRWYSVNQRHHSTFSFPAQDGCRFVQLLGCITCTGLLGGVLFSLGCKAFYLCANSCLDWILQFLTPGADICHWEAKGKVELSIQNPVMCTGIQECELMWLETVAHIKNQTKFEKLHRSITDEWTNCNVLKDSIYWSQKVIWNSLVQIWWSAITD